MQAYQLGLTINETKTHWMIGIQEPQQPPHLIKRDVFQFLYQQHILLILLPVGPVFNPSRAHLTSSSQCSELCLARCGYLVHELWDNRWTTDDEERVGKAFAEGGEEPGVALGLDCTGYLKEYCVEFFGRDDTCGVAAQNQCWNKPAG